MKWWERIIDKTCSGRFVLTLVCGYCFVWAVTHKMLSSAVTATILVSVFKDYFNRDRNGGNHVGETAGKSPS